MGRHLVKKGDRTLLKTMNRGLIIELIKNYGPIARVELSKRSGLVKTTCSHIVDQMLGEGLIVETGKAESTGGKSATLLNLNPAVGIAVGVKLEKRRLIVALVNLYGTVLERRERPFDDAAEPAVVVGHLAEIVQELVPNGRSEHAREVLGIGLAVGGIVDTENGVLLESHIREWRDVPLRQMIEARTGLPVHVENDSDAFIIGEKLLGCGKHAASFLCVIVGYGIGLGMILNNQVYRAEAFSAGEFGHTKIETGPDAPLCSCGNRGCLEAFASIPATLAYVRARVAAGAPTSLAPGLDTLSMESILAAARAGDALAGEALARIGSYVGIGVANLISIFGPEMVIVAGDSMIARDFIAPALQESVMRSLAFSALKGTRILTLPFDDNMWVRGAAMIVMKSRFSFQY